MKVWGLPNPQRRLNKLPSILWEIDPLSLQAVVFDKLGPSTKVANIETPDPPVFFCWWFFKRGPFFSISFSESIQALLLRSRGPLVHLFWNLSVMALLYDLQPATKSSIRCSARRPWLFSINFDNLIRNHLAMYISTRSLCITTP